jgi:hypothetical protein
MLLRRIKQHVANENWFAVFVDFVIVVVGVYVGIEVSNWNEARQEDARADEYLERIRADLVSDQDAAVARREFWAGVIEYGEAAIRHAETGELYQGSVNKTVLAYYQASQVDPFASVSTTYDEMKAAGELGLVRNAELRAKLASYYVKANNLQAEHLFRYMPRYRVDVRGLMPIVVQHYVFEECYLGMSDKQALVDCVLPIDDEMGTALLQRLRSDVKLIESLRFWIINLSVSGYLIDSNMRLTDELLAMIDAD